MLLTKNPKNKEKSEPLITMICFDRYKVCSLIGKDPYMPLKFRSEILVATKYNKEINPEENESIVTRKPSTPPPISIYLWGKMIVYITIRRGKRVARTNNVNDA